MTLALSLNPIWGTGTRAKPLYTTEKSVVKSQKEAKDRPTGAGIGGLTMNDRLRSKIAETCGSEYWEPIGCKHWNGDTGFDLWIFEHDIDFEGDRHRVVIIQKCVYDAEFPHDVDYSEDIFFESWIV